MSDASPSLNLESVRAIAKKDVHDAARSKVLWLLSVLFVAFLGGAAFVFVQFEQAVAAEGAEVAATDLVLFLEGPVAWLLPLIGLLVGYKAVAGEVDSGTGKILFTLPHSRLDVVVGKLVGRTLVLWATFLVGLVVSLAVIVALYDELAVTAILTFAVLSMLLGAVFVSIGVTISALTTSTTKAAAAIVGVFVFLYFVFDSFRLVGYYLLTGSVMPAPGSNPSAWYLLYPRLNPIEAYSAALNGLVSDLVHPEVFQYFEDPAAVPFYLSGWFALVLLLVWLVVPPALGYLRFRRLDL
ncbi:ABC transporter permease subunit [Natrialbaceae archaeon AArc-T1-2]|uniref:ABC transporter permease subunit n=1 Tax=Natrialbaceae archaeon AArc-T1-2 TaxID=3053904 RepID=UPI00255A9FEB|nr:ABC transporter permease subunit [Natrialbaceae archaeon AArc-T1-2]WIV68523.1 ABC transporter permease subunit [Natrialbaceae archaeon AArc-T1-2]